MTTITTEGQLLTEEVRHIIAARHLVRVPPGYQHGLTARSGHVEDRLLYHPRTGQPVGSMMDAQAASHAHRFVVLSTHHVVTAAALAAVWIDAEGTVHQPGTEVCS